MSDRRPMRFWQPFNDWWRAELDKLGRRPDAQEIVNWYHANAHHIWGVDAPTLLEARVHAKALRPVTGASGKTVKDYFRRHRAQRMTGQGKGRSGSRCNADQAVEWEDGEEGTTGAQHMASRCNPSESAEVPLAPYMALLGGDCSRGLTNPMPFPLSLLPALGAHTQPHHEDPTGSGPSAQQASKRRRHTTTSIPDPSVFYNPLGHSGRLASGSCSASQPFVGVGAMGVPLHRRISDPLESGQQLGLAATQGMQQEAAAPLSCLDACSKPADVVAPPYQSLTSPADGQYTGQAMADPRRSGFVEPAHIMEEAATAAGSGLELLTSAVATIVSPEKRDHSCASAAPAPTAASSNSSNNGLAGPHSGPPPHAPGPLQQEAIANYLLAQAQLHAHQMLAYKLAMAAVAQQLTAAAPASDIGDVSPLLAEAGAHNPKSHDLTRGAWHAAHSDAHGRLVATDGYEREDKRARATAYV